ncbi:hypothetical protein JW933_10575, partial [candidate division FCPU426 bacterium]|nr:hypothetical protein [candidate division FCPU426 bacterium]
MKFRFCLAVIFLLQSGWAGLCYGDWLQLGSHLNLDANESAQTPSLSVWNGTPYVAWFEPMLTLSERVYVKHWNGNAWVPDNGALNWVSGYFASDPTIAHDASGVPYATWHEWSGLAGGKSHAYSKHYNGAAWMQNGDSLMIGGYPWSGCGPPKICVAGTTPYVAWREPTDFDKIFVKHYNGAEWI